MPEGGERPIAYVSRTLSAAEQNYSQLEKEGLACIFGVKKFHNYIFGHPFELVTDHKPLLGLLKEDRATSPHASARIKRWSLLLALYEYTLKFRRTSEHANADALSRLPLATTPKREDTPPELVLLAEHLKDSPVTAKDIKDWTSKDPQLSRVLQYTQQGWPQETDAFLQPYTAKRAELSAYDGCVLRGSRVVVPPKGRDGVLQELHEGHPGMTKMKGPARMYVWWPGLDEDIENKVHACHSCQEKQANPPLAPLNPWQWPSRPWSRLHLDFAGPFMGKTFLIIVDAHSKWIDACVVPNTSSNGVIERLRVLFAMFGLPETIVTDTGPGFVSQEFRNFLTQNGIKYVTSAPYHPASNGLAERAVQTVKKGLKKVTDGSWETRLAKILFKYRITPQSTTGMSPAELSLGHRPRSRLDLLKPFTAQRVEDKQLAQKKQHDKKARQREFDNDDQVSVRNYSGRKKWQSGQIERKTGPVSYRVKLTNGSMRRCHVDQLRSRRVNQTPSETNNKPTESSPWEGPSFDNEPARESNLRSTLLPTQDTSNVDPLPRTYPRRVRHQPARFEPGKT